MSDIDALIDLVIVTIFPDHDLIYSTINEFVYHLRLNEALRIIVDWCEKLNLTVKKDKMLFANNNKQKT